MNEEHTIHVRLNGKDREIDSGLSIKELVKSLDLNPRLIVVELNREIISQDSLSEILVLDGDHLELVHFVGGG